jgi:hypothetical protein
MGISRRGVLLGGMAAGAGLAAVAATGAAIEVGIPAEGLRVMSARELAVVRALAEVMFPRGAFPLDGLEAGVAEEVDRLLAEVLDPLHASGFRTLLHTLEWGTLASRGATFSALPAAERAEVVRIWADPSVFARRIAGDAFKIVLGMAYFAHPAVLRTIGWSTGCANEERSG